MPDQTVMLGQLADEFTARVRAGQMPDIAEYAAQHPELAARIRELFPTLMLLEGMAGTAAQGPATDGPAIAVGTVFGNYRIERELGRGGMGVVYEALHQPLAKRVALKVLAVRTAVGTGPLERFLREARTAASLHHTNIVPVFDVGQCAGTPYYAMQYIEGRGLDQVLRDLNSGNRTGEGASDPLGPTLTPEAGAAFDAAMSKLESREQAPDTDGTGHAERVRSGAATSLWPAIPRGHVAWADFFRWTADLGIQAAEGIAHAHQRGVIHRDIKPSNLILDSQGVLWITDFGLARRVDDPGLTKSGSLLGTPRYMSPEQAAAAQRPIGHRTDIYSLGASLYELLACRPAFEGATPMEVVIQILDREPVAPHRLNPAVPTDLETIVLKAMAKRPEDRYQSAAELADDLRRWVAFEPIRARQISPLERLARWCRRNPAVATLTMTVAALLLTIAVSASIAAVRMRNLAARERDAAFAAEKSRQTAQDALRAETVALVNAEQARNRAEEARAEAERDRNRAVASHEQSLDHLARSLFEQAHALGTSRQTGRRWQILDRLREAEQIRRRERPAGAAGAIDATGASVASAAEDTLRGLPSGAALRSEALAALLVSDGRVRRASELGLLGLVPPAISRDSHFLAVPWIDVGSQTSGARLIDLSGELAERRLELPDTPFAGLALDGSGRLLATGTMAGVTLWALPSGEKRETLRWPVDGDDQGAAGPFAPPGEIIVSLSDDGRHIAARRSLRKPEEGTRQIVAWNLDGPREPQVLARGKLHAGGIAFSGDGNRLAFPSSTTGVTVWNFESGEKLPEITPSLKWGGQLEFCHADQWLVLGAHPQGSDEGAAVLWDLEAGRELTRLNRGFTLAMAASPDSRLLAVAGLLNEIRILRMPQGDEVARLEGAHVTVISLVRWSADGRGLVSVGIDGSLRQWDLATDVPLSTIDAGLANAARLAFSSDGRWLAVGPGIATRPEDASRLARPGNAPPIRLVDRASGRVEKEFALGVIPGGLVFRSDSRRLAALSSWSAVAWEIETGEVLARFDGQRPPDQVMALSCGFDEAGNLLVTRRVDKRLTVFNPALERDVWQPPENADVSLGFLSPDSRRLVVWPPFDFKPQTWTVWNLPKGIPAVQLPWSGATNLGSPVFSRDNDWLAISYLELDARALGGPAPTGPNQRAEYGVALFHLPTARKQTTIRGTTAPTAYEISPDSRLLAIGQRDGSVLLWDVAAAEELVRWEFSSAPVASVSFASDGGTLAACDGQSGAVRLLDLGVVRREFTGLGLSWER